MGYNDSIVLKWINRIIIFSISREFMLKFYDTRELSAAEAEAEAEEAVAMADFDGDGKVNFKEFVYAMTA